MQDLGTLGGIASIAYGINDSGQVVGDSYTVTFGIPHAFLWDAAHGMQDLGTLPGDSTSAATGINDSGQVVGISGTDNGPWHAFLWDATHGMQDLGTLPGDSNSYAYGINASGQVVGFSSTGYYRDHAFLWQNGTMTNLQNLISGGSGWSLRSALGINNAGQIAGSGVHNGQARAFLLTPDSSALPAPAGRVRFSSSDAPAVVFADDPVPAADAGVQPFSLTLGTLGDQVLTGTAPAEATRIGRATAPGTSDAAAPAGGAVPNATDAWFASSHRADASVSGSDGEVTELERGASLLPTL